MCAKNTVYGLSQSVTGQRGKSGDNSFATEALKSRELQMCKELPN